MSFSAVRNTAGSYSARVADIVKDFTVEQPVGLAVVSPVTAGGSSSIMWLVLVLLAAALLFFLWFLLRRKKKKKKQPVAEEMPAQ